MSRHQSILWLVAAFVLAYLLPLGTHGLWIPDETRYAQISQEMLHSGNWVAPHFMGLRYFEKPAAGYWLIAVGQAIFGENLFGVRIASALASGLTVLLVYLFAQKLWSDPRKSFTSALLFMSYMLIAGQAGYANLDPQFMFWVTLSLVAFWYATHSVGRQRLLSWALLGLACGMGFMTKGFLAWALPVIVALPYMVWQRRLRELLTFGPLAILVAAIVCLPWVLAVHAREPDYWRFFFWHEHIRRFAGDDAQHSRPWWFYLPLLFASSAPWAVLLPGTLKQAWQERRMPQTGFLLLWLALPLAFLSMSRGKLPTYIMPCMIPLALMMGHVLVERLRQARSGTLRTNGVLNAVVGVVALVALLVVQHRQDLYDQQPLHLTLAVLILVGWILANALQGLKPLRFWALPAAGAWLGIVLIPIALPDSVVFNKTPDQFVVRHIDELTSANQLLSNDLGAAAALSWRLKRKDIVLYDTQGELKYGLNYPQASTRAVDWNQVQAWMTQARREGSVAVLMRGDEADNAHEFSLLPADGKRYEEGNLTLLIFDRTPS
ncbi:lipid IV(A) 4-amino-4-deoxy-L-arabinosyltransferase [Pseudomonas putida]|uniref:lipid IV(A) 4-amino-4-deoxy-L-arabinosyltransferase n=1 Tax=Pseudomonas putida TaxID=303 RepID=UPI0023648C47|nr:lipid IV(A) 4-amino-4-deoxy-L-arabinosyltransferase [Pseudomonas putida]MDD1964558.1 lipid IV(A) 4-amino-4-deoxy-L-arabinosyltransferase [Pseudomonas putida]